MGEYRIVIFGSVGVGKSALTIRFIQNNFIENYDPTIEDSYRKLVNVDDESCLLDILDTAGQDQTAMYHQYGQGFILVYDITSRNSFSEITSFRTQALRAKGLDETDKNKPPMILVGNKCDIESEREVSFQEGKELAESLGCAFFETSAKANINVEAMVLYLAREIIKVTPKPKKRQRRSGFFGTAMSILDGTFCNVM